MTFQEENDKLLFDILDQTFFVYWKENNLLTDMNNDKPRGLQINVTYACNQKCEYCYLIKYGDQLYPKELDQQDLILANLKILLSWFSENYPNLDLLDIFTGEIWQAQFGLDLLQTILDYKGNIKLKTIMIPSNMSFLLDSEQTKKIQNYIDLFQKQNIRIMFSSSVDGLYIEDYTRPLNNKSMVRDQAFYDRLFEFNKKNKYAVHPMLSAYAIEHWKENYLWWYKQCSKYDIPFLTHVMLLEVRNDDWTDAKIESYLEFLNFQFDFVYNEIFHKDRKLMMRYVFGIGQGDTAYQGLLWGRNDDRMTCSISNHLAVRLGDLSICPCHRTSYPQFLYGNFVVEDGKIIGLHANNPQLATHLLCTNMKNGIFGCDDCIYTDICLRQCLGSCYENNNDLLIPLLGVCHFFHNKFKTLLALMEQNGLIDEYIDDQNIHVLDKQVVLNNILKIKEWYKQNGQ